MYSPKVVDINQSEIVFTDRHYRKWFLRLLLLLSHQSCLTPCDPIDGSPPGSHVPRILKARTLEWFAISFSNVWKWEVKVKLLRSVRLLATPWTEAYQAPPSMRFSRQEYWSGVPFAFSVSRLLAVLKAHTQVPTLRLCNFSAHTYSVIPGTVQEYCLAFYMTCIHYIVSPAKSSTTKKMHCMQFFGEYVSPCLWTTNFIWRVHQLPITP